MYSVEMRVERVLTSVLLAALRTNYKSVLGAEMHVLDVPLEAHLVEILVAVRAAFTRTNLLVAA